MTKRNRILAAEDSTTQALALETHLRGAGFEVTVAPDGEAAFALLEREPFDLLISDVVMPGMDGYELCRRAKEHDEELPVVLLTSLTDPLDVINALSAGADNFLRKPYQPEELVHRARSMLFNRQLRDSGRTQMGLEVFFLGRRFMINAEREQILDLLISTFEDLVTINSELRVKDAELIEAHERTVDQLAETELERDRLKAVLAAVPEAMVVIDANGVVLEANEPLGRALGLSATSMRGRNVTDLVSFVDHRGHVLAEEERAIIRTLRKGEVVVLGTAFDLGVQRNDGSSFPAISSTAPIRDASGAVVGAVGILQDIGLLVEHDAITGLPGHGILIERMRAANEQADGAAAGLLVVAVDRYDRIRANTSAAGHDLVLATLVERLQGTLESDRVRQLTTTASAAYLGAGEVAVVLPGIDGQADAIVIGELIADEVRAVVPIDDVDLAVTVSVGVGMIGEGADPASLVATVAAAAREARSTGGGRVVAPDPSLHAAVIQGLRREQELRVAIATDQLVVHYQPQLQLRGEAPMAAEALVRWQHPERGLLGAADIIPLAVESDLIAEVSWWVLERACRQAAAWRRELPDGERFTLSVNVAPEQLADESAVSEITRIVADTGVDPTMLILEIPEGSVTADPEVARERLAAIKSLGIRIAVDDFGTGYSSLLQLRQLPIDILKVDRGFITTMLEESADGAIVAGTVRLARALGLEVVAEGVETLDQLVQLRVLGCDLGQGYYWSRPLPAEEFAAWWAEHVRPAAADLVPALDDDAAPLTDDAIAYLIHELRTPLTAVTGFAELLAESDMSSSSRRFIEAIVRNAHELAARLAHVEDARGALEGGIVLEIERVDVAGLVRTVVADVRDQLAPHRVVVAADQPAPVAADGARLAQALMNLLSNAAKFSPASEPVEVAVTAHGSEVCITVRDHGPGIPAHRRHELFRRFSRLGSRAKGMGVGLYLSRLIVDAHGGSLRYEPAPDGGSVFAISLPAAG